MKKLLNKLLKVLNINGLKFIIVVCTVAVSALLISCNNQLTKPYEHCRNVMFKLNSYVNCGDISDFIQYSQQMCKEGKDADYGRLYGGKSTCKAAELWRSHNE